LVVALLQWLIGGWLLGLGELVLGTVVLLYAHGPGRIDDRLEAFILAWRQGRLADARQATVVLAGEDGLPSHDRELPLAALDGVLWQTHQRLFGPVLWFLILGPVGPLLFRLVQQVQEFLARQEETTGQGMDQAVGALSYALDWLPVRAAALSFALAGSFVTTLDGWGLARDEPEAGNRGLLRKAGLGAIDLQDACMEPDVVEDVLRDVRSMITRSFMIWLAVVALLTIAGWLY
jgi:AmpE protein